MGSLRTWAGTSVACAGMLDVCSGWFEDCKTTPNVGIGWSVASADCVVVCTRWFDVWTGELGA